MEYNNYLNNMETELELQFEDDEYYLVDCEYNDTIATTDKILLKEYDGYMKKLSRKNCDIIRNEYDLDQLAKNECNNPDLSWENELAEEKFKKGFLKALALIGDNMLIQNEFDVEIVMECCGKVYSQHCDGKCENVKPLIDKDGFLILKRKTV